MTQTLWFRVALFVVVAVLVGLVGMAVATQFEPEAFAPGATESSTDSTTTTTAETQQGSITTVVPATQPEVSTESTLSGEPAGFEVSTASIDFGDDATSREFEIVNTGGEEGSYTLGTSTTAISLSAPGGDLAPGESATIQLSLDRNDLSEGDIEESISVRWEGGQIEIAAVGSHVDNPIIHNPKASPSEVFATSSGSSCGPTQTTVSARVRDTSELATVAARWGGTETDMSPVGNDIFEAVIGPFANAQTLPVKIVATDEFGNAGGATIEVEVTACN